MRMAIIIPAAGASTRMRGRDKLMETVGGCPLLVHVAQQALNTGWQVVVALSAGFPERQVALEGMGTAIVQVARPEAGMARSIGFAVREISHDTEAVMIVPADMPDLKTDDFLKLTEHFESAPDQVWRGTSVEGQPGHPVIFPLRMLSALQNLREGDGASDLLKSEHVRLCTLPGNRAITDLDTPEDWDLWRDEHKG